MKKQIVRTLLILTLLPGTVGAASEPGIIRGTVLDAATRFPVPGANVVLINTEYGAAGDLSGRFKVSGVSPGNYHVQASAVGYKSDTQPEVLVLPGRSVEVEFLLEPTVLEGTEVTVKTGYFKTSSNLPVSTTSFSHEEVRRAPGSGEDVQRAVQALPGVFSRNDQNNEIIVRGGSPSENLTIVDGMEIDNINHFPDQSTSGGPLTAVNSEFLKKVTFSTGGFSARYGDRLSSVMDLEIREGDPDLFSGQLELTMAGAGANFEGGLPGSNGSYLFSWRKSYLDLIQGPIGLTAIPHYWDAQFKIGGDLYPNVHASFTGIYAQDQISVEAESADAWSRGAETFNADGYNLSLGSRLRYASRHGYTEFVLGRTEAFWDHEVFEIEKNEDNTLAWKRRIYRNKSTETTDQFHAIWNGPVRDADEFSAGVTLKPVHFQHDIWAEPDTTVYDFNEDGSADTTLISDAWQVETTANALKYGAFAQYKWRPAGSVAVIGGLRVDGFDYSGESTLAPRLSLQWEFIPDWKYTVAVGKYYQALSLLSYSADPDNRHLPHPGAEHFVMGLSRLVTESCQVKLEAYYKKYHKLPVSEQWLNRLSDPMFRSFRSLAIGRKDAWGWELFFQQKLANNWYGTLAYSYGKSETAVREQRFAADYDFRHIITLVFGYYLNGLPVREFQKNWYALWLKLLPVSGDELTFSTRFRYVSGRPLTPYIWTDAGPELEYHWMESGAVNSARYPAYSRWDVRWDSKWFFRRRALVVFLEVENVLDRPNVAEYIYGDEGEIKTVHQFRFLFVGGFRFEW